MRPPSPVESRGRLGRHGLRRGPVYPNGGSKAVWQFAVGRSAHAELQLEYDGKEAFYAPRGNRVSGRDKPYWLGFIESIADAKPEK